MGSVEKGHIYGKFIRTRGYEHKILGGTPLSAFIGNLPPPPPGAFTPLERGNPTIPPLPMPFISDVSMSLLFDYIIRTTLPKHTEIIPIAPGSIVVPI